MRKDWTAIFDSIHYGALIGVSKETLSLKEQVAALQERLKDWESSSRT